MTEVSLALRRRENNAAQLRDCALFLIEGSLFVEAVPKECGPQFHRGREGRASLLIC